ncbi:MAG: 6,7-dimethyl-8-ribityllumazine synthase [Bacteroidota bacterium]
MSSSGKNLSSFDKTKVPDASAFRFGIVVAEWNSEITEALYNGAFSALTECGAQKENIIRLNVPGSFELTAGAKFLVEHEKLNAVICLGCVIQGETRHFEFICTAVSQGLTLLAVRFSLPFIFGVLTTDNQQQAIDRAGGKHGNKGIEAAVTAIKMADLKNQIGKDRQIGFR